MPRKKVDIEEFLPIQITKGLLFWSTLVPLTVNSTNIVKTQNTQSIVGTLIPRNIEISTVPLIICMVMDQMVKKVSLIKINCQLLDLRHHIRSGYSSVAGKLGPIRGCKLQG
jgi:hypothetical protein